MQVSLPQNYPQTFYVYGKYGFIHGILIQFLPIVCITFPQLQAAYCNKSTFQSCIDDDDIHSGREEVALSL